MVNNVLSSLDFNTSKANFVLEKTSNSGESNIIKQLYK